jgi:hypothetical protein
MKTPDAMVLERLLPRWRAKLPARFSAADVDGFIRRNRATLEIVVARALARRKAGRGELPDTADEFAAYDPLVARGRPLSSGSDRDIIAWLGEQIQSRSAEGHPASLVVLGFGVRFVDMRAEALFLHKTGWDPVVLFLDSPAVAFIVADKVAAVRDLMGNLAIHPDRRGRLNHLHFDLNRAEKRVIDFHDTSDIELNTIERLERFAEALWSYARAN